MAFIALFLVLAIQPRVTNAKLETRSAAAGLDKEFRALVEAQAGPVWIGYAAPLVPGRHQMCCWHSGDDGGCCGGCRLESSKTVSTSAEVRNPVKLEGPSQMLVLFRVEQKKVEKVRTFTEDCELDAGGLPFYWLPDVRPAESVALLAAFATAPDGETREGRRVSESALAALALHGDPAADRALISLARDDASAHVRGQALFWLAQKAGRKAAEAITQAIEQDPETEVKKRAVFALSQLPKDEGVPLLIQVARTNRNPAVRKQAFFWLGQSRDSRALAFLEEVLTKP